MTQQHTTWQLSVSIYLGIPQYLGYAHRTSSCNLLYVFPSTTDTMKENISALAGTSWNKFRKLLSSTNYFATLLGFFFSFCKRILHLFPWELFYFVHQFSYVMSFHLKLPFAVKRLTWFKKVSESDCCLHFSITSQMTLCVLPWFCTSPILSDKHTVAVFLRLPCMSNGEKSLKFKVLNRKWWNGLSEIYIT